MQAGKARLAALSADPPGLAVTAVRNPKSWETTLPAELASLKAKEPTVAVPSARYDGTLAAKARSKGKPVKEKPR